MKIDPAIFSELKLNLSRKVTSANKRFVVVSAYQFNTQERKEVQLVLSSLKADLADIDFQIDKQILAGLILKSGSTIIDLSLRGQLQNLKQELYEST